MKRTLPAALFFASLAGCASPPHRSETRMTSEPTNPRTLHLRRSDVMSRPPDSENPHARVWTMRQTEGSRTNLVEMRGRLSYHVHPDAEHTLLVLAGRLCAWSGTEAIVLEEGDYISIPRGVPHRYETLTPTALLMSFDAPAYDPAKTVKVPEEGVVFAPCPSR
jgi:mannose-6-phosphate isomerase-like protein (cupin superfamily)